MNKHDLCRRLAEETDIPLYVAQDVVNLFYCEMKDALVRGERIEIRGFGSFTVRKYKAYTGRNPQTGELVEVPPKRLPFFKVGKDLMNRVNP